MWHPSSGLQILETPLRADEPIATSRLFFNLLQTSTRFPPLAITPDLPVISHQLKRCVDESDRSIPDDIPIDFPIATSKQTPPMRRDCVLRNGRWEGHDGHEHGQGMWRECKDVLA